MTRLDPGRLITALLNSASDYVSDYLHDTRDQVVSGGQSEWDVADTLSLHLWNTNNHQLTWGVVKAALEALNDYMNKSGYGEVEFSIFDGAHEVGQGAIQ